jgi:hypothetical protein
MISIGPFSFVEPKRLSDQLKAGEISLIETAPEKAEAA